VVILHYSGRVIPHSDYLAFAVTTCAPFLPPNQMINRTLETCKSLDGSNRPPMSTIANEDIEDDDHYLDSKTTSSSSTRKKKKNTYEQEISQAEMKGMIPASGYQPNKCHRLTGLQREAGGMATIKLLLSRRANVNVQDQVLRDTNLFDYCWLDSPLHTVT
jgi:hypothetical protein